MTQEEEERGRHSDRLGGALRTSVAVLFVIGVALFWILPAGVAWVEFNLRWWADLALLGWIAVGIAVPIIGAGIVISLRRRGQFHRVDDAHRRGDDPGRTNLH